MAEAAGDQPTSSATRLTRLHPYPAMVADELATCLAERYSEPNSDILDPFCGSGRLLMAFSDRVRKCVGVDVNPLACLITKAKSASPNKEKISELIAEIKGLNRSQKSEQISFKETRKVEWFDSKSLEELGQILAWINDRNLDTEDLLVIGAILSGTVRDVSYCRKGRWKLHRMSAEARNKFAASPWDAFEQRLKRYAAQIEGLPKSKGNVLVFNSDFRALNEKTEIEAAENQFDAVVTSPPYGDSRTTVQYGAASGFCLDIISNIRGLEGVFTNGSKIDAACLGGRPSLERSSEFSLKEYWAGGRNSDSEGLVRRFLSDYADSCNAVAKALKPGGVLVYVVGCRSTGGFRLKLDKFTIDQFSNLGFVLHETERRKLQEKRLPKTINKYGRSKSVHKKNQGVTNTISEEIIIHMRKSGESNATPQ